MLFKKSREIMRVGKHQHFGNFKKAVLGLADEALGLLHFHFVEIARDGDAASTRKMLGNIKSAEIDAAAKRVNIGACVQIFL